MLSHSLVSLSLQDPIYINTAYRPLIFISTALVSPRLEADRSGIWCLLRGDGRGHQPVLRPRLGTRPARHFCPQSRRNGVFTVVCLVLWGRVATGLSGAWSLRCDSSGWMSRLAGWRGRARQASEPCWSLSAARWLGFSAVKVCMPLQCTELRAMISCLLSSDLKSQSTAAKRDSGTIAARSGLRSRQKEK